MASFPFQIILVGDSDISRWPETLLPNASSLDRSYSSRILVVSGTSGATLNQIIPYVKDALTTVQDKRKATQAVGCQSPQKTFLIICAGENDTGNGTALFKSEESLNVMLKLIFGTSKDDDSASEDLLHLLFLGPKFEPWLTDDLDARKSYVQMSRSFELICRDYSEKNRQSISLRVFDHVLR